ncbi:MAG: AAA family ATPase [Chitinophagales bacterium]|nr:AAA family ATPase [Chitinophagales bacterium]
MPKIFLIGFMGSGKSTVGKQLASLLNYEFIDLDDLIERNEQSTINDIFIMKGEEYFRTKESFYLKSLDPIMNAVVATGGGTPCFSDNMKWMNEQGITVYLKANISVLSARLNKESDHRPLLKNINENNLPDFITAKLKERERYYLQSKYAVDADKLDGESLLRQINF